MSDQDENQHFESEVRQIARFIWKDAFLGGAELVDNRERDGIFETRDTIHVVEATVSRKKDKAHDDAKKTSILIQKMRGNTFKTCQGWIVTKSEPTSDQREAVKKFSHCVRIVGFEQFRSLLFNGSEYIRCRDRYRFGSIHDYKKKNVFVDESEFVPVDFSDELRTCTVSWDAIVSNISNSLKLTRCCVIGEYGSGKSMTLRALYALLRVKYNTGQSSRCPIYLNLRDHNGQRMPVEALERHARNIGYSADATDLVKAWRAGCIDLILDGFDEMATAGWGGSLQKVRAHRMAGMKLISEFLKESPQTIHIIVAGRENFFDSHAEMRRALGLSSAFSVVRTSDFNDQQLAKYLKKHKFHGAYPDWLPARPLLVSYLLAEGLVPSQEENAETISPASGWDRLLGMIADREAGQDDRLDGETVRNLIERLATIARSAADGLGNFDILVIQDTFRQIVGFPPDEAAQQFILRLPGLGPTSAEDSSRSFVDRSLADAAAAGDVWRFLEAPFQEHPWLRSLFSPLSEISAGIIADRMHIKNVTQGKFFAAIARASDARLSQLSVDLTIAGSHMKYPAPATDIVVSEGNIGFIEFVDANRQGWLKSITYRDCLFGTVLVDSEYPRDQLPVMRGCIIGVLSGILGELDLPASFANSQVEEFSSSFDRNAKILTLELPDGAKVLMTILNKLFLQSGRGRQEGAFYRGAIGVKERRLIPEVLQLIRQHGFAVPTRMHGETIWLPNRSATSRAQGILSSPMSSKDDLLASCKNV